jgi:hypothetical protein
VSLRIINARHTARGITHLPDFELIGSDVVEYRLLLLLDCVLQVIDSGMSTRKGFTSSRPRMQQASELSVESHDCVHVIASWHSRGQALAAVMMGDLLKQPF